jgi:hypothetical protein
MSGKARAGQLLTPSRPATRPEIRIMQLPKGAVRLGALAGTTVAHPFVPDGWTGSTCLVCFGWCTDPRHNGHDARPTPPVTP